MWHILKADLQYYKFHLLVGAGISLLNAIVVLAFEFANFSMLLTNSFFVYFITFGIIGAAADKDKRNRHDTLLPLPVRETAVSRLLFILFFQLSLLVFWFIVLIFSGESVTMYRVCFLFSANGMNLALVAVFVIHHDLGFFGGKKYQGLTFGFFGLAFVTAGGLAYFRKLPAVFFSPLYTSPAGALLFNLIAAGLFFLCSNIFVRRKSYLA